jgi:glycosyltransferase involved in cell wall biosynthesis
MSEQYPLTVATPWYPTPYNRMAGSFVAEHAALAASIPMGSHDGVHVVHALEWPGGSEAAATTLRPAFDDVLDRLRGSGGTRLTGAVGPLDRVPVFTVGGSDWAERGRAMVRDVRRAIGGFDSPIVHGHVGYLGGLLAARLAEPGAAVFATEHSTALRQVLSEPGAREHYAELLERARAVFCVSNLLREQVLEHLADPEGKLVVLPNPVDFAAVPRRPEPPQQLRRWVFVGGLIERKGVERLVRAFTVAAREDDQVTLTLYGSGALADRLVAIARDAGVGERLLIPGVVRHRELLAALPDYDLLLAPSTYETFHLAVPEAVAAGLPVIVTRSGGPQEALAGVEDQVGTFVDVEDSPDALVQAWRELSKNLDRLDLDGARAALDARYGRAAIAARLAQAYGLAPPAAFDNPVPVPIPASRTGQDAAVPQRVVLVAVSGWRRYHVEAELDAARRLAVPLAVVTDDPQITGWAAGQTVLRSAKVALGGERPPVLVVPLAVRVRRLGGRLRRWLVGRVSGEATSAARPAGLGFDAHFLDGATLVLGDCQSLSLARAMLAAHPTLRPVVELDRTGVLGPPPDSEAVE